MANEQQGSHKDTLDIQACFGSNSNAPVLVTETVGPTPARRQYPAITHFLVLSAVIVPIALLPYALTRHQLSKVYRQVSQLEARTRVLQHDLNGLVSDLAVIKSEHRRARALLHDLMQETDDLRAQADKQESERMASYEAMQSDLRMLLDETQHARTQAATLRALGTSLADVAAFMHEVELEMGMKTQVADRRGVERLRLLALKMQSIPQQNKLSGGNKASIAPEIANP